MNTNICEKLITLEAEVTLLNRKLHTDNPVLKSASIPIKQNIAKARQLQNKITNLIRQIETSEQLREDAPLMGSDYVKFPSKLALN